MNNILSGISIKLLKKAIKIRAKMDALESQLAGLFGDEIPAPFVNGGKKGKRKMSAAGRKRIAAAQKARWAKLKGKSAGPVAKKKGRRKMSAAAKKALSLAAKARWAKARAAGKNTL